MLQLGWSFSTVVSIAATKSPVDIGLKPVALMVLEIVFLALIVLGAIPWL